MVQCKLVGRLGNQCFQIANSIAFALRNGHEYHIPTTSENEKFWPATFKHLANPNYSRFANTVNIKETQHDYRAIQYDPAWKDYNIVMNGYYQALEYFEDYIDEVRAALAIPYQLQKGFVGIHVRRTDYTELTQHYVPLNYKYYRDAVGYFFEYGYKSFVVCSDDINWCKVNIEKIKKEFPLVEFTYAEGQTPLQDMALLSSCEHAVIANSSFSLFAFHINPNPDKFCIAPAKWHGPANKHLSEESLYPKNCVKL